LTPAAPPPDDGARGRAVPIVLVEQPDPTGERWDAALTVLEEAARHAAAREAREG
jgi:hypothetical protein